LDRPPDPKTEPSCTQIESEPISPIDTGHRIGDAWAARSKTEPPRDYFRVRLDDPGLPGPITAALFPDAGGETANLVWSRKGRG
jgi:uncharacterized protein (DUF736 family)